MIKPVPRPKRPPVLIAALVALPLAAVPFGMTTTSLGGPREFEHEPPWPR